MKIGIPKEIKVLENRVGLVPPSVRELVRAGHEVIVERNAGEGIGCRDEDYELAGARVVDSAVRVFDEAELIVKVKEPQLEECEMLRPDHVLFTYLHLAADAAQAEALCRSGATAIAYETVTDPDGSLPLLTPMSEIAGCMSVQVGTGCLHKINDGAGILLGGVAGVPPANVLVLGGGVAGTSAIKMALGLGASVTVVDKSVKRLRALATEFGTVLGTAYATTDAVEQLAGEADLIVGAVLVPGAGAPKLLTREMIGAMKHGSVVVDISIDQGGCFETSKPTTHREPTFTLDGVVHYCVTNMPGAVPRTSAIALNNVTLPYVLALANDGYAAALDAIPGFAEGVNVRAGKVVHPAVAEALGEGVAG